MKKKNSNFFFPLQNKFIGPENWVTQDQPYRNDLIPNQTQSDWIEHNRNLELTLSIIELNDLLLCRDAYINFFRWARKEMDDFINHQCAHLQCKFDIDIYSLHYENKILTPWFLLNKSLGNCLDLLTIENNMFSN